MNSQEAIATLLQHRDALRAQGVRHAALFGSVARGEARPDSDLDILIELEPDADLDVFGYVGLFAGSVDVVNREALKSHLRPSIGADAIYAF
jgi:predicted nucleotidyltransferase